MTRFGKALACVAALTAMIALALPAAAANPVSPPGLELTRWEVTAPDAPKAGDKVAIGFTLKNVTDHDITLDQGFGVAVGCRWRAKPGAKKANRDFGHKYQGVTIPPGLELKFDIERVLDLEGQWLFWPAFNVGGQWGTFDAYKKVVNVGGQGPAARPQAKGQGVGGATIVKWQGRNLALQVFPPDNPWNQDVSKLPVHPKSQVYIDTVGAHRNLHPDFGSGRKWNLMGQPLRQGQPHGLPYVVVRKGQPLVPISFRYADESDPGPYPIPADPPIEPGNDKHILIIDYDAQKLYEIYKAAHTPQGWQAGSGAVFDLASNALRPFGWTSADAAGLPIFPGLVRHEEVFELGEINHALRFSVRKTRRAYIPPATHFASRLNDPKYPPMGLRVRLKADFDITPFPPVVQVILRALKKYGMILADNGGPWFITGAPHPEWNDDHLAWIKKVKGRDLEVVYTGEPMGD